MKIGAALLLFILLAPAIAFAQTAMPDAQHQFLARLAGHWSVTQSLWLENRPEPKIDTGEAELAMVLKDEHLRQTLHINDGTGFEGLSYFGYDTASGQAFSTWMDVNFPGLIIAYGKFEPETKRIVLRGIIPGAEKVRVREVLTFIDSSHIRYDFYETQKNKEALVVRLDYARLPGEANPH